eukprot:g48639.t1
MLRKNHKDKATSLPQVAPQASLDLLRNPDWTDTEVYTQYLGPTGSLAVAEKLWNQIGNIIPVQVFHNYYPVTASTITGHCPVGYSRWCHIHSPTESDWSNHFAPRWKLFFDNDPPDPPFNVFDSQNSYNDPVNSDIASSPSSCDYTDTSSAHSTLHAPDTQHALSVPGCFVHTYWTHGSGCYSCSTPPHGATFVDPTRW